MEKKMLYLDTYKSPIGELFILSANNGLLTLSFSKKSVILFKEKFFNEFGLSSGNKINKSVISQIGSYFNKKLKKFDVPMILVGTNFQKKIWTELLKIKYGEVISYKELAERAGLKKGYQAVGQANSKNNIVIIIPCHRVIAANNKLGGYSGGLNKKKNLLKLEGVNI